MHDISHRHITLRQIKNVDKSKKSRIAKGVYYPQSIFADYCCEKRSYRYIESLLCIAFIFLSFSVLIVMYLIRDLIYDVHVSDAK